MVMFLEPNRGPSVHRIYITPYPQFFDLLEEKYQQVKIVINH